MSIDQCSSRVMAWLQIDAIGGARFDDGAGGDNEVQRTMLEIVNQLDGFDSRGNIKARTGTSCHSRHLFTSYLPFTPAHAAATTHAAHVGPADINVEFQLLVGGCACA